MSLVLCNSEDAASYIFDAATGNLVLQTEEVRPPVAPEPGKGPGEGEHAVDVVLSNYTTISPTPSPLPADDVCLSVLHGSLEDGAVLTLRPCVSAGAAGSSAQKFAFSDTDAGSGSRSGMLMIERTGQCVTAGWPFFTGVAFEMSDEGKDRYDSDYAVVLLNEAEEVVNFDLSFPAEGFTVRAEIGPRSIQTILA